MSWRTTPDDSATVLISSLWEIKMSQIIRSQKTWRNTSAWSVWLNRNKNLSVSAKTSRQSYKTILTLTSLGQKSFDWDKTVLSPVGEKGSPSTTKDKTPQTIALKSEPNLVSTINNIISKRSRWHCAKQHVVVTNGRVERSSLANMKQGKRSPLRWTAIQAGSS